MKIKIVEHCFGKYVAIDGVDVCDTDDIYTKEDVNSKRLLLLEVLKDKINSVHPGIWIEIAEHLVDFFDKNTEESSSDICEQCGNWNSTDVYEEQRKQALIDMMQEDEELGLYDE